jgi:hypothetical protein
MQRCSNCGKPIEEDRLQLHEVQCQRFCRKCPECA